MTTTQTEQREAALTEAESIIRTHNGVRGSAATALLTEYDRRGYEIERLQQRIAELGEIQQLRQRVEALEARGAR